MPFPSPSPYDILGISPSAKECELKLAYQRAVKERRYAPGTIAQAFNDLRNPLKRAEIDLLVIRGVAQPQGLSELLERQCSLDAFIGTPPALPISIAVTSIGPGGPQPLDGDMPETTSPLIQPDDVDPAWRDLPPVPFPD